MYQNQAEKNIDSKIKAENDQLNRKINELETRIQNGCRKLTRAEFDLLPFRLKMDYPRMGGEIEG